MMRLTVYHNPVLLAQAVGLLAVQPNGCYIDATLGGGGHTRALLQLLGPTGKLYAFDQDADASPNAPQDARFTLFPTNFSNLTGTLLQAGVTAVDGILADLGVSSHQFDEASRGFSYRADGPLDMRMDVNTLRTAADVVNLYPQAELYRVFSQYGQLPNSNRLAHTLVRARAIKPFNSLQDLLLAVQDWLPSKDRMGTLSQLFQALRIEVNDELNALKSLLSSSLQLLKPGGRLVVISYHSLEDRLVKHFLQAGNFTGEPVKNLYGHTLSPWQVLTRKPITPEETELQANPRSRSAKLRAAQKI